MAHGFRVVASLAALRGLKDHRHDQVVLVRVAGGEELYYFIPTSTDADDALIFIKPDDVAGGAAGRWKLVE